MKHFTSKSFLTSLILPLLAVSCWCCQRNASVQIGNQVWMSQNLNVSTFRNGDPIPEAKTQREWLEARKKGTPAWCYYDNDPAKGVIYGKLYNWYAVNDPRGLAPEGWHIPSDAEWSTLVTFLGGRDTAGEKLKSSSGWDKNGNGTNESGFNAAPAGFRTIIGQFDDSQTHTFWWSSSVADNSDGAWIYSLSSYHMEIQRAPFYQYVGLSVRCIKD